MRLVSIKLESVEKRFHWRKVWPLVGALAVWGTLVSVAYFTSGGKGAAGGVSLCNFKNLTGHPCAVCGSTRAVMAALRGDIVEALRWNPLMIVALTVIGVVLLARVLFRKRVRVRLSKAGQWVCWTLAVVVVVLNWVYLWNLPGI